jgi:hypothetical protein
MRIYKVKVAETAKADVEELADFLMELCVSY